MKTKLQWQQVTGAILVASVSPKKAKTGCYAFAQH